LDRTQKRVIILLLFFSISLSAKELSIDFFADKPRSFIKDFYISQYLDTDIKPQDARELLTQVNNLNLRLFYKFADKVDDFSFTRVKYCLKLKPEFFEGKTPDCIAMGLTPFKATKLEPKKLINISTSIKNKYPLHTQKYRLIATRSFEKLFESNNSLLISTFNSVGKTFRQTYLNHPIPESKLQSLTQTKAFSSMVVTIIRDPKLEKLQKSILKIDSSALSSDANFLLALNAINQNRDDIALWYLKLAQKYARLQFDKDKALFWQYLLNKDKALLQELIKSKSINIYTLYAYETLGLKPKGILTTVGAKNQKAPFDATDPFAWLKVKANFKNQKYKNYEAKKIAALKLNSNDTEAHVARLIYKFSLNQHYFLMPHFKYLSQLPKNKAAIILAIARQESRFIPTAVSYSYALGIMQFMPYVAKDIAKKNGLKDFKYEDLFDTKIAYKFADIHLNFLEKSLYHPLFIAYAYNAGIGFTRRQILQKEYFKEGKYEPFYSLEMIPNSQARKYGKKVLANYVVYAKILGEDITLKALLDTLKPPHRNHRF